MPPIVSCLTNSFGRFGADAAIEHLPALGIEYLELPVRTAGVASIFRDEPLVTTDSTPPQLQAVARRLSDHGLKLSSCNVTTGNPLDPANVLLIKRKLDVAAFFGVHLVVGAAGETETPEERATLDRHLTEIGDHAARLGITYCFETHPGLCRDHYGMLDAMQTLQHPHLKLNFDTANILYYNEHINGEIALAKVCQHVRHMHLKDSQGEFGAWYFPALGNGGAVDFARTLQLMRGCGFNGPYSIELEGVAGEPELTLEQTRRRLADSIAHLRTCGYFD